VRHVRTRGGADLSGKISSDELRALCVELEARVTQLEIAVAALRFLDPEPANKSREALAVQLMQQAEYVSRKGVSRPAMTLMSQAEYARRKGVSPSMVSKWKVAGLVRFSNGLVDVEATDAALIKTARPGALREIMKGDGTLLMGADSRPAVTLMTQAQYARRKSVTPTAVSQWKAAGLVRLINGLIDVEATDAALIMTARPGSKRERMSGDGTLSMVSDTQSLSVTASPPVKSKKHKSRL